MSIGRSLVALWWRARRDAAGERSAGGDRKIGDVRRTMTMDERTPTTRKDSPGACLLARWWSMRTVLAGPGRRPPQLGFDTLADPMFAQLVCGPGSRSRSANWTRSGSCAIPGCMRCIRTRCSSAWPLREAGLPGSADVGVLGSRNPGWPGWPPRQDARHHGAIRPGPECGSQLGFRGD